MDLFGRHSYYQAHELKPGSLYLASRGDDVQLVLGIEPVTIEDATGILIIRRISGSAFTSDFVAINGETFAYRSRYMLLQECVLAPSQVVENWKMTENEAAPLGSLYSKNGSMFIAAKSKNETPLIVNCGTGQITNSRMNDCFWTQIWTIMQKDRNEEWKSIL